MNKKQRQKVQTKVSCRFSYLNDSNNVSETALQVAPVDEHAKREAGSTVTVYQLSYEPRT